MDTAKISAVLEWMKATDLVEVAYKRGGEGFALRSADAPAPVAAAALPPSRYVPVAADSVGVLQWAEPGRARKAEEGSAVTEGQALAVIVGSSGAPRPVKAPCAGRVAKCFVEAGEAVEYGRPLFLIEPR